MAFVPTPTTATINPLMGSAAGPTGNTPTNWPTLNRPNPYIVAPTGYPPVKTTGTPING